MKQVSSTGAPRGSRPAARRASRVHLLLVLMVLGTATACAEPEGTVGAPEVSRLASPAASAGPQVPIQSGDLTGTAAVPPTRLGIPRLRLTATVDPVGIEASTGDFAVPPSIDRVGWYRYGPGLETTAGSIVIAGHVDSAEQGKGAFFRLRELAPEDRITVTGADGTPREFVVVGREIYQKTAIPLDKYFARDGAVRLTLITCGGPFDPKTRHYRDNVVITAQPVGR